MTDLLDLADDVLRLRRFCSEHPMPLPKPSCPQCARNAGIVAAARLIQASDAHEHEWSDAEQRRDQ